MSTKRLQRGVAVLGSTGSIGTQALEIIALHKESFRLVAISGHSNVDLLTEQIGQFRPAIVAVTQEAAYQEIKKIAPAGVEVLFGEEGLKAAATHTDVDVVLAAIVGFAGLHSTLAALEAGKEVALANKETLVVAGELVMALVAEKGLQLLPVDSEHSAIFQCLQGEQSSEIEKIVLTASGGPFLGRKPNFLVNVKAEHALQHPNWTMGAKITIDSATLMNKGLEMIEAKWLFNLRTDQIEIIIHPQSIVHSFVQFCDGSVKAQLGLPDMKLPIQYALGYPNRLPNNYKRFSFKDYPALNFEQPDIKTFRNLGLAIQVMEQGGNAPCILNAANEEVVHSFLKNKVGFLEMSNIIEECLQKIEFIAQPDLNQLIITDKQTRELSAELIKKSQLAY